MGENGHCRMVGCIYNVPCKCSNLGVGEKMFFVMISSLDLLQSQRCVTVPGEKAGNGTDLQGAELTSSNSQNGISQLIDGPFRSSCGIGKGLARPPEFSVEDQGVAQEWLLTVAFSR